MGEWRYSTAILDLDITWGRVVSFTPLARSLSGLQGRSGRFEEERNLLPLSGVSSASEYLV
jgi:hypothetical protein